jgi:hypothetical protein
MAKRSSYQSLSRDSAYYERIGMQAELERLQKQADEIRAQLRRYPAHILRQAEASGAFYSPSETSSRSLRSTRSAGAPAAAQGRTRSMSAAARKRISDAQKARWAKQRATGGGQSPAPGATEGDRGARKRGRAAAGAAAKRSPRKRTMSPEARKRIADAQRRRWAAHRKQKA